MNKRLLFLTGFLFVALAFSVSGQSLLEAVTDPFVDWDFNSFYQDPGRAFVVDAIVYGILFIFLAVNGPLGKMFGGKSALAVVFGIVLAVGMSMYTTRIDFRLFEEGQIFAVIIFVLFLVVTAFRILQGTFQNVWSNLFIIWLLITISGIKDLLLGLFPSRGDILDTIYGLFTIAAIFGAIQLGRNLFKNWGNPFEGIKAPKFGGGGGAGGGGGGGAANPSRPPAVGGAPAAAALAEDEGEEEKEANAGAQLDEKELDELDKIKQLETIELTNVREIIDAIEQLKQSFLYLTQSGKRTTETDNRLRNMIGNIKPRLDAIKRFEHSVEAYINDLEILENEHGKLIEKMVRGAANAVQIEKANQGTLKPSELDKLREKLEALQITCINKEKAELQKRVNEEKAGLKKKFEYASDQFNKAYQLFNESSPNIFSVFSNQMKAKDYLDSAQSHLREFERMGKEIEQDIGRIKKSLEASINNEHKQDEYTKEILRQLSLVK